MGDDPILVRLEAPEGPDGFWPRANYFAGGAANGYAVALRSSQPRTLGAGRVLRLEVANHVPHLPYTFAGPTVTVGPERPALLAFQWDGRIVPIGDREVAEFVQHGFDPGGTTESVDAAGHPVVQQGRRGAPVVYDARVVES